MLSLESEVHGDRAERLGRVTWELQEQSAEAASVRTSTCTLVSVLAPSDGEGAGIGGGEGGGAVEKVGTEGVRVGGWGMVGTGEGMVAMDKAVAMEGMVGVRGAVERAMEGVAVVVMEAAADMGEEMVGAGAPGGEMVAVVRRVVAAVDGGGIGGGGHGDGGDGGGGGMGVALRWGWKAAAEMEEVGLEAGLEAGARGLKAAAAAMGAVAEEVEKEGEGSAAVE
ncbi:hypothetical protein CYMTET_23147 [Cymbomonas tetramitiformis]|uniref:Uncharacterized protein n=1 Tax=Cymbomonas tetramitiformis TaxID=36881 RepID=A0AAE0FYR8_9CHLO|nr:hypothetical protein CYMTET_23147 [Cymbomonas tetramitiformis]